MYSLLMDKNTVKLKKKKKKFLLYQKIQGDI